MELTRLSELRPRGVWDLADDAFDLYRERFALLAGLAAAPFVPAHLLNTLLTTLAYQRLQAASGEADATSLFVPLLVYAGATAVGQPVLLTAQALQTGLTATAIERRLQGETPGGREVWKRTFPHVFALLGAGLLAALVLLTAHLLTCGLGIWLAGPLLALLPVVQVVEKRGIVDAWRRAWRLGTGGYGRVFGLTTLVMGLEFGLLLGLAAVLQLLLYFVPAFKSEEPGAAQFVAAQVASAVGSLFLAPLRGIAVTLLYFDGRVRTEGLDLEELARSTGVELAETPR